MRENRLTGCKHVDSHTGVCLIASLDHNISPSLSQPSSIIPLGEIEGPALPTEKGFMCKAALKPLEQKTCSHFSSRTQEDDERDENI